MRRRLSTGELDAAQGVPSALPMAAKAAKRRFGNVVLRMRAFTTRTPRARSNGISAHSSSDEVAALAPLAKAWPPLPPKLARSPTSSAPIIEGGGESSCRLARPAIGPSRAMAAKSLAASQKLKATLDSLSHRRSSRSPSPAASRSSAKREAAPSAARAQLERTRPNAIAGSPPEPLPAPSERAPSSAEERERALSSATTASRKHDPSSPLRALSAHPSATESYHASAQPYATLSPLVPSAHGMPHARADASRCTTSSTQTSARRTASSAHPNASDERVDGAGGAPAPASARDANAHQRSSSATGGDANDGGLRALGTSGALGPAPPPPPRARRHAGGAPEPPARRAPSASLADGASIAAQSAAGALYEHLESAWSSALYEHLESAWSCIPPSAPAPISALAPADLALAGPQPPADVPPPNPQLSLLAMPPSPLVSPPAMGAAPPTAAAAAHVAAIAPLLEPAAAHPPVPSAVPLSRLSPDDQAALRPLCAHLGMRVGMEAELLTLRELPPSAASVSTRAAAHAAPAPMAGAPSHTPPKLAPAPLGDAAFGALARLLAHEHSSLATLAFARADMSASRADALARAIARSARSPLATLNLDGQPIGPAGAHALVRALEAPGCALQMLSLRGNGVCNEGALELAAALEAAGARSRLRSLDLSANGISEKGAIALADCVRAGCPLRELLLRTNGVCDRGAVALAASLEASAHLRRLDLQGNALGDVGVSALAHALRANRALRTLALRGCQFGDVGASALASALRANSTLAELDCFANAIGDGGCAELADALCANAALHALELDHNRFGPAGGAALGAMLHANAALRSLALSSSSLGDEGMAALAGGLRANRALARLALRGDQLRAAGVAALASALRAGGNCSLAELDLDYTQLGAAGAVALGNALGVKGGACLAALVVCAHGLAAADIALLAGAFDNSPCLTRLDLLEPTLRTAGPGELLSHALVGTSAGSEPCAWHFAAHAELCAPPLPVANAPGVAATVNFGLHDC
ncbi:hypothetical protein KFE25_012104 [Diacronema lutheri]|uniref:Uncharacterized protein n=1 Tax=Diacronema lutheri TaxID=2081491 RepID=A0A8J5XD89_DIALT|nr:hypothetical protein KFE25_012104 [Diacronema lutheri]